MCGEYLGANFQASAYEQLSGTFSAMMSFGWGGGGGRQKYAFFMTLLATFPPIIAGKGLLEREQIIHDSVNPKLKSLWY